FQAPGCDATIRNLTLNRSSQMAMEPYCAGVVTTCTGTGADNFEQNTYTGTLILPSPCQNWLLTTSDFARFPSRNLPNAGQEGLFTETLINNQATQINNSPTFGRLTSPYFAVDKAVKFNHSVMEPDGDSLVYSL